MYLWSIDIDAVLVSMSCFALLCEEADIRCSWDEVTATVTYLLPNYHVYQELAAASTILTTGNCIFVFITLAILVLIWFYWTLVLDKLHYLSNNCIIMLLKTHSILGFTYY